MHPCEESLKALVAIWHDKDLRAEDKAFVISRITAETEDGRPSKALKKRARAWRDLINEKAADLEVGVDFMEAVGVIE